MKSAHQLGQRCRSMPLRCPLAVRARRPRAHTLSASFRASKWPSRDSLWNLRRIASIISVARVKRPNALAHTSCRAKSESSRNRRQHSWSRSAVRYTSVSVRSCAGSTSSACVRRLSPMFQPQRRRARLAPQPGDRRPVPRRCSVQAHRLLPQNQLQRPCRPRDACRSGSSSSDCSLRWCSPIPALRQWRKAACVSQPCDVYSSAPASRQRCSWRAA